jgi:hypothetical protein
MLVIGLRLSALAGSAGLGSDGALTERSALLDIVAKKVSRADGGELGKPLQQPLRLGALSHPGRADQDDASGLPEPHGRVGPG